MRANFQRAVHAAIKLVFSSNAALYSVAGLAEQAGGEYANIPCRKRILNTFYLIHIGVIGGTSTRTFN